MADHQIQDAKDLIAQMKMAIKQLADESAGTKDSAIIEALELDLQGVVTKDAGGNFKFAIFGNELGVGGKLTKEQLQKITISLVPQDEMRTFGREDISDTLLNALRTIRDTVAFAATDPPKFKLGEAAAELSFEVTNEGSLSLFVEGKRESVATQTARIKLKSPEAD